MNDYIKREDAMVAVEKFGGRLNDEVLYEMKFALFILPTVEAVKVKHGHWEWVSAYGHHYRCSECGGGADFNSDFCPNCGAKMDKEQEYDT